MRGKEGKSTLKKESEQDRLYEMIQRQGDSDKVLEGIHENFLGIRYEPPRPCTSSSPPPPNHYLLSNPLSYLDPSLTKTAQVFDWLEFTSMITQVAEFSLSFQLQKVPLSPPRQPNTNSQFVPYAAVAVRELCHVPFLATHQIQFPKEMGSVPPGHPSPSVSSLTGLSAPS